LGRVGAERHAVDVLGWESREPLISERREVQFISAKPEPID
jgi:hypothetical protein